MMSQLAIPNMLFHCIEQGDGSLILRFNEIQGGAAQLVQHYEIMARPRSSDCIEFNTRVRVFSSEQSEVISLEDFIVKDQLDIEQHVLPLRMRITEQAAQSLYEDVKHMRRLSQMNHNRLAHMHNTAAFSVRSIFHTEVKDAKLQVIFYTPPHPQEAEDPLVRYVITATSEKNNNVLIRTQVMVEGQRLHLEDIHTTDADFTRAVLSLRPKLTESAVKGAYDIRVLGASELKRARRF